MNADFYPVDEISQHFPCQARHDWPAKANVEVWLDERQKVYLCLTHAEDLIRKTTEGNPDEEVAKLRQRLAA